MGRHLAVGCLAQRASRPSRGPRAPPPPLGDGGPGERDRHREADRVDCVRIVHLTETCEDDAVHLITHAMTTVATVHEARCTEAIHAALAGKGLVPAEHLVDAAYVDAELLVREPRGATASTWSARRGRTRAWQAQGRGRLHPRPVRGRLGRGAGRAARRASCPRPGAARVDRAGAPYVSVRFREADCGACPARPLCTRAGPGPAPAAAAAGGARGAQGRPGAARDEGGPARLRAGGPGSRAPSRRACAPSACAAAATAGWPGRTCSTWRPRPRSTSQRLAAWFRAAPRAATRTSRFAALAPPEPTSPAVSEFLSDRDGQAEWRWKEVCGASSCSPPTRREAEPRNRQPRSSRLRRHGPPRPKPAHAGRVRPPR